MHKPLLLAFAVAAVAQAAGMLAVTAASAKTGKRFGDVRGAKTLTLTGVVIAAGLVWLALTH